MDNLLKNKLQLLEARNAGRRADAPPLKVYYGCSRLNKVQKKEAIAVFFENETGAGSETSRSCKTMTRLMDVVAERLQTREEKQDAAKSNRVFSVWYVFMDDKHVKGSLEKALAVNAEADRKHVRPEVRDEIAAKLREHYLTTHPGYREPIRQLEIEFPE